MTVPLDEEWPLGLDTREARVLELRLTETLADTGRKIALTREGARQVELRAQRVLVANLRARCAELIQRLDTALTDELALSDAGLSATLPTAYPQRRLIVLAALGVEPLQIWRKSFPGWWSRQSEQVQQGVACLADAAPFPLRELTERAAALGLYDTLPLEELLTAPGSPVLVHATGPWLVRRSAVQRDAAFLWLADEGQVKRAEDIAGRLQVGENAMREQLRRDDRFAQLRPEGSWALTDWNVPESSGPRSALDAVVAVLSDRGPLVYRELVREVRAIYPVTEWRISQCMNSDRLGEMPDGRVGLVADGATLVEEREPPKPDTVAVSGDGLLVAVKLSVNPDLLRGSGLPLPPYVGWFLGLRHAPQSRQFRVTGSTETITVTKNLGIVQVSALRRLAEGMRVTKGCTLVLLLRLDEENAQLRHACSPACPTPPEHQ